MEDGNTINIEDVSLHEMIKIKDERIGDLGNSNYYYYNFNLRCGIVIKYTLYDEETATYPLRELFGNDSDISMCKNGMKGKIHYYKTKLSKEDYKDLKIKKYIENCIELLYEQVILFSSTHKVFLRKMNINILLND